MLDSKAEVGRLLLTMLQVWKKDHIMYHLIRASSISEAPNRTRKFEGDPYGAGVSFFAVDLDPGEGPAMHLHPYPETWLILSGMAEFEVEEETLVACAGDVVVVPPQTPHRFTNSGDRSLAMVCIHANGRVIQRFLNELKVEITANT